ncbi:MAG: hypothetical protein GX837_11080 [Methanomicrobiales archaeon]|nr:hypothetical protein [Methanomicrobiales archaeon]
MVKIGAFLRMLAILIPAAAAATITISPEKISPGDTVTVDVQNLPDGAAFSLGIRSEFAVTPGERFAFTARDLVLPFSLGSGEVSAYSRGTEWTGLSAQMPDGASVSLSNNADANGEFRTTQSRTIPGGTYTLITLDGRAAPTAGSVTAEVTMQGTKTGPENGQISFGIDGVTHGTATVTVYVDGREALSRVVTIGSGSSSAGPGTATNPTASPTSGSVRDPSTGGEATPFTGSSTATSADGKVSLTGTDIEGAGLLAIAVQGTVPAGWSISGNTYAVTPEGREFSPAATVSFRLPSTDGAATLARLDGDAWVLVPSRIEGDSMAADITRGGPYALLTAASSATTTPVVTVTTSPSAPAPATTAAPITPLLPVIALAILISGWKRRE